MAELTQTRVAGPQLVGRIVVYTLLIVFALYYLMPLFVMITTSVKTLDDIRAGNLVALPAEITFDAWRKPGPAPAPECSATGSRATSGTR